MFILCGKPVGDGTCQLPAGHAGDCQGPARLGPLGRLRRAVRHRVATLFLAAAYMALGVSFVSLGMSMRWRPGDDARATATRFWQQVVRSLEAAGYITAETDDD